MSLPCHCHKVLLVPAGRTRNSDSNPAPVEGVLASVEKRLCLSRDGEVTGGEGGGVSGHRGPFLSPDFHKEHYPALSPFLTVRMFVRRKNFGQFDAYDSFLN